MRNRILTALTATGALLGLAFPVWPQNHRSTHQAQLRSHVSLPGHWNWNTSAYFVRRLPAIPPYTRLDTNLVWQLGESLSITFAGANLLKAEHMEFMGPDSSVESTRIERSGLVKLTWRF